MHCSARVQPDMKGIASHSISMSICQSAAAGQRHTRVGKCDQGRQHADTARISQVQRALQAWRRTPGHRFKMHSKPRSSLPAAPSPHPHRPRLTLVRAGEGSAVGVGRVGVAR